MKSDNQPNRNAQHRNSAVQGVVFDFDGTLSELHIDFREMRSAIDILVERYRLLPGDYHDLYILEIIDVASRRLSDTCPETGKTFLNDAMKVIEEMEIRAAGQSSLFDGVKEMLRELAGQGIATGIITRNCLRALQTVFPDYGDYVGAVITREMTRHVKPDPLHLTEILSLLDIPAAKALMVGDHPIDILIGREVGAYTAAVLTGTGKHDELRRAKPDFLLADVIEIKQIIMTMNNVITR